MGVILLHPVPKIVIQHPALQAGPRLNMAAHHVHASRPLPKFAPTKHYKELNVMDRLPGTDIPIAYIMLGFAFAFIVLALVTMYRLTKEYNHHRRTTILMEKMKPPTGEGESSVGLLAQYADDDTDDEWTTSHGYRCR